MAKDKARFFRASDAHRKAPTAADRLREWGERIRRRLAASKRPNRFEGLIFRPSTHEADTLVRLEGHRRFASSEITVALEDTETRFREFLGFPSDRLGDVLHEAMENLAERILGVVSNLGAPLEPDTKPDTPKNSLPDSVDVRDLCRALQKGLPQGRYQIEIAREFVKKDDAKAESLLRQARRYRHLWQR